MNLSTHLPGADGDVVVSAVTLHVNVDGTFVR